MRLPNVKERIYFRHHSVNYTYAIVEKIDLKQITISLYSDHNVCYASTIIDYKYYYNHCKLKSVNYLPAWF